MDNNINSCNIPRALTGIQPIGYMFILDRDTLKIKGFSHNVLTDLNFKKEQLYEVSNFTDILHEDNRFIIYNYLLYKVERKTTRIIMLHDQNKYYSHIYKTSQYLIIELEKKQDVISLSFEKINLLHDNIKLSQYSKESLINSIKEITKFKRILLYEFTDDWDGFVSTENTDYDDKSFQDIYFYQTDIPHYVRGLFCKNPVRYIYDRDSPSVGIDMSDENMKSSVDMSHSEIITLNSSHKEYLKSINVVSSLSIAILVDKKLWGLVICHDDVPHYISPFIRQQCRMFVEVFSDNITKEKMVKETNFNDYIYKLYTFITVYNFISKEEIIDITTFVLKQLKDMIKCDSLIGCIRDIENVLDSTSMLSVLINTNLKSFPEFFISNNATDALFKLLGVKVPFNICKALIVIKINDDEWVGFVNKGEEISVSWSGSNILRLENDMTYPRDNFDIIQKKHIFVSPFNLSHKNLEYIKQILLFLNNRLNENDFLTEYFISHNISEKRLIMSNILHEVRNPLNAISGLLQIMDAQKEYNQSLVNDGIKIVNQILDLSSNLISLDKYKINDTLKISIINWDKLINDCIQTYKYMLNTNVMIEYHIPDDMPNLLSDTLKIQQILSNLVSNSVKYTKKGKIIISVELLNKIDKIWWVRISVKDTGVGIPLDKQIRLFKTFEQIESEFIHSSGIGLIICSKLVSLMNGKISFESEENIGTVFKVLLPLPIDIKTDKKDKVHLITKPKLSILIADDQEINLKVLLYHLKDHDVIAVQNGQEAIDAVSKKQFDVILMDLQMPIIDGIQATEIIRNKYNFQNKIIAVTGHDFTRETVLQKGFDDIILKPVDFKHLFQLMYSK